MNKKLFIILVIFSTSFLFSQVVYEPAAKAVYPFLERLSNKGIIELNNIVKPLSRKYIADKLIEVKVKNDQLSELEKEELEYFEKDYFFENEAVDEKNINSKYLHYFEKDALGRYRIFSYGDKIFKLNVSPILGIETKYPEKDRNTKSWMGLRSYGYLLNNIGVSLDFRTTNEKGTGIDILREFSPEPGIIPEVHDFGQDIGYTDVKGSMSVDWGWGNIVVAKEFIEYGYAKFGNLVLSNKAPSFPYIRIELKPVDWFTFNYFHAWLSSTVIDSVNLAAYKRDIYINKYMAWHSLMITPTNGLDISIGESVVYSDKLELLYLMPIMFYFPADDYLSNRRGKPGDANQQIFLSVSSKNHLKNTHFYSTLFVDELTIGGINGSVFINTNYGGATSRRQRTQIGYTLGLSVTDLPIDNLTFAAEYTRINPFVYGHHDPAQTYRSSNYLMGHWMGHNSDLFYMDLNYRFFRGFQADIWGSYIRKGSNDYSNQYLYPSTEFLFGLKNYYTYLGLNIRYELLQELNVDARFKLTKISNEQTDGSFSNDQFKEFSFSIYYGI